MEARVTVTSPSYWEKIHISFSNPSIQELSTNENLDNIA